MTTRTDRPLTPRQWMVLALLTNRGEMTARDIEAQHVGLTADGARKIIYALAWRGLVDVAGWDETRRNPRRPSRTYKITAAGREAEQAYSGDRDDD